MLPLLLPSVDSPALPVRAMTVSACQVMAYIRRARINATTGDLWLGPGTNNPVTALYQVVNVVADGADVAVGVHADSGFVNFTGCPPGQYMLPELTCAACPRDTVRIYAALARATLRALMAPPAPAPVVAVSASAHAVPLCPGPPQYKAAYGNAECAPCFPGTSTNGTTGASSPDACLCPAGTFALPRAAHDQPPCGPCPVGAQCPYLGMRVEDLLNEVGYWRGTCTVSCVCVMCVPLCYMLRAWGSCAHVTWMHAVHVAGDPNTTQFDECLERASCSVSGRTELRAGQKGDGSVHAMYSTPCAIGSFGPLCGVCRHSQARCWSGWLLRH